MKKALMLIALIFGTTTMVSAQAKPANNNIAKDAKAAKAQTEVKQTEKPATLAEPAQAAAVAIEAVPVEAVKPVENNQKRKKS